MTHQSSSVQAPAVLRCACGSDQVTHALLTRAAPFAELVACLPCTRAYLARPGNSVIYHRRLHNAESHAGCYLCRRQGRPLELAVLREAEASAPVARLVCDCCASGFSAPVILRGGSSDAA